jgi:hypothetical protein
MLDNPNSKPNILFFVHADTIQRMYKKVLLLSNRDREKEIHEACRFNPFLNPSKATHRTL